LVATLAFATAADASTYRPNKLGDHAPNGCTRADCTLREAVIRANEHPGRDTIVLRSGKAYRRGPAGTGEDAAIDGDLDITDALTIKSSDRRRATVDADGNEAVFASDAPTRLKGLRIKGGDTPGPGAGGITAIQLLSVRNSIFTGNVGVNGGAIRSHSSLVLNRSKLLRNNGQSHGGGISSSGQARIVKSTIAGNEGGQSGGGVENFNGSLTVVGSTISGNETGGLGGGGIDNSTASGTLRITNTTIASNRTTGDGGGIFTDAPVAPELNAVTLARNRADSDNNGFGGGGGIANNGSDPSVRNSLIALNAAGSAGGPDCLGSFDSGGHNLIGTTFDCNGFVGTGDLTDLTAGQIKIGSLARNGGPTKTIALRRGSRAINKAGSDAPNRDQRGKRRRNPDIGAFERTRSD
jgi:hypothetical protein